MAAWEESAAEWSGTNSGAFDSGSTASAAEKENLGRCRGHLLLVHIAHDAAGKEQGMDSHQRVLIIKGVGKGGLLVPALHCPDSACHSHGGDNFSSGLTFGIDPVGGSHHSIESFRLEKDL